jgi:transcriptional regulator with PAS, ATPase and Fis domain
VLPPLRQRREDIPAICDALLVNLNQKHDSKVSGLHPEVIERFEQASWPGNVRQLRNVLERAVIIAHEGLILPKHLRSDELVSRPPIDQESEDTIRIRVGLEMREVEEAYINLVLKQTNNNKIRAAEILGVSARTLYSRARERRETTSGCEQFEERPVPL